MRCIALRTTLLAAVGLAGVVAFASPVLAATTITSPGSPYAVTADGSGTLQPFTIKVAGFKPNVSVYIEQCSGQPATAAKWTPTLACDVQSSPAAAITDGSGVATFAASDPNHAFHPFSGASPQNLFSCTASGAKAPEKDVPNYDNCQVRVATTNVAATDDQVFLTMTLPGGDGSSSASSGSDSSDPPYGLIAAGVVVVVVGGGAFLVLRRRRA